MRIYLLTLEVAWSQSAISLVYLASYLRYGIAFTAVEPRYTKVGPRSTSFTECFTVQFTNMTGTLRYNLYQAYFSPFRFKKNQPGDEANICSV